VLAAVQRQETLTIFVGRSSRPEQGTIITTGKSDGIGLGWMPDGNLLSQNVDSEFFVLTPDGKHRKSLFKDEVWEGGDFSICRNGRFIIFARGCRGDETTIWRAHTSGNDLKQLTQGPQDVAPDCSPNGQSVTYLSAPHLHLRRVSIDGGATFVLTDHEVYGSRYSPDGREVADIEHSQNGDKLLLDKLLLIVRDSHTGLPTKSFDLPPGFSTPYNSRWWPLH